MRYAYPILLSAIFLIVGWTWMQNYVYSDPKAEGVAFLRDLQKGSLAETVKHFGGNACRCPTKGGWGSYLIYVSGQEPNLAFMCGKPFMIGSVDLHNMHNNKFALVPWEQPEDRAVDVQIDFSHGRYQPLFLPLPMAYGKTMTERELDDFLKDPDKDAWKGFTLRFRPSLKPGTIAPPAEPLPREVRSEFKSLQEPEKTSAEKTAEEKKNDDLTDEAVKKALGVDITEFLTPKDAGKVIDAQGQEIPQEQIEKRLPKLKNTMIRLHVVRRGELKKWTIFHFGLMYPVLSMPDGQEVKLVHDARNHENQ